MGVNFKKMSMLNLKKYFNLILFTFFIFYCFEGVIAQNSITENITRVIDFSGCTWNVKSGYGGPGPNYWSDSEESVWVDGEGRLHLKIRKINGNWYCAEIYTQEFTDYGEHRFLIEGRVDQFDRNVVLGLFTYYDDTHEIDIEFSKWGSQSYANIGSFTIQPYTVSGNSKTFPVELNNELSTHYFNWQPDYVLFGSMQGHHEGLLPSPDFFIQQWIYWGDYIPQNNVNHRTHINFWLFSGNNPLNLGNLEMIITKVDQPITTDLELSTPNQKMSESFQLYQNYPNPFNPETTIHYYLDISAPVKLDIYNISGRKITTLVNGTQNAGDHHVLWKGRNMQGNLVVSGIYFYSLKIGNKNISTNKMLIIR